MCDFCHQIDLAGEYVHQPVADGLCDECHSPHGGDNRFFLRSGAGAAACLECHDDVTEGMAEVHGPVASGACTACHQPHASAHASLLNYEGRDLCLDCHAGLQSSLEEARIVHGPVADDCETCHRSHASEHKMLLTSSAPELCVDCHSEIEERTDEATVKHEAVVKDAACASCHTPHGGNVDALLKDKMIDVCLSCHNREMKLADGSVLANTKAVLSAGKNWHGPIAQDNCTACHEVHGGTIFRLLIQEYPPEFYSAYDEEKYALCFECHDSEIASTAETTDLTDFRNGEQNLHFVHVNKAVKGRTCRACHQTHASSNPKHVRDEVPFGPGGWSLPVGFTKTDTGGRCNSGCHRIYAYDRVTPVVLDFQREESGKAGDAPADVRPRRRTQEQP
jgi:predicted CXXCH cytochrome family protein